MQFVNDSERFIPFTSDYGFKATFGNESNTLFLKRALQALIGSPTPIVEVTFDKSTFEGITKESRSGIFDLVCVDELGNTFIVEMQLSFYKYFMQRLKFYGSKKFDTLVKKGDFDYGNLTKIYCIGILAQSVSDFPDYRNVGCIKNQDGLVLDDQMTYIIVELDKFNKKEENCQTDLEKLIYTMKALQEPTKPIQYPKFWTEEWIKVALDELDTRNMTPDERFHFEMTIAHNAEAVREEKEKIKTARQEENLQVKKEAAIKLIKKGILPDVEVAEILEVPVSFIEKIRKEMSL